MSEHRAAGLERLVAIWVDLVAGMSLGEFRSAATGSQFATIGEGAAGNAYALWHVGARLRDEPMLREGLRWWRASIRAADQPGGVGARSRRKIQPAGSILSGRIGIHAVGALLAHALDLPRIRDRALRSFCRDVHAVSDPAEELYFGAAGSLVVTLLLERNAWSPVIAGVADGLARSLMEHRPTRPRYGSIAHGEAGIQLALLAWARARNTVLPVPKIAYATDQQIARHTSAAQLRSYCTGYAGFIHLWLALYRMTGDRAWLDRARSVAPSLATVEKNKMGPMWCCGYVGRAYSLLALAAEDSAGPWYEHAVDLALHTTHYDLPLNGIVGGTPALICLAADLQIPAHAAMPVFGVT